MRRIERTYYFKTIEDHLERTYKIMRERFMGFDYSIFSKVIKYYRDVKGKVISNREALS